MKTTGSVSQLISALKNGESNACDQLWERYCRQLMGYTRNRMSHNIHVISDEEDLVLMAFSSVFRRVESGQYPNLVDRHGLWRLLAHIATRKLHDAARYAGRQCRSATTVSLSTLPNGGVASSDSAADAIPEFADLLTHLLGLLPNEGLRKVCLLRLDGFTNSEIASRLDRSITTIERRLGLIRSYWELELDVG